MNLDRRTLLKGAGGLGVVAVGGAAMTGAGSANAHADTDYTVGDVELSSDTGEIDYVATRGQGTMEWIGLEEPATHVRIISNATGYAEDGTELQSLEINDTGLRALDQGADFGNHDDEFSGEGTRGHVKHGVGVDEDGNRDADIEWVLIGDKPDGEDGADYGVPQNSLDADEFTVDENGAEETFYVIFETTYILYTADDEESDVLETTSEGYLEVTVDNIDSDAGSVGDDDTSGAAGGVTNEGELDGAVYDGE